MYVKFHRVNGTELGLNVNIYIKTAKLHGLTPVNYDPNFRDVSSKVLSSIWVQFYFEF